MTKKEITQKLTDTAVTFYCDYLEARDSSYYEPETLERFWSDTRSNIFALNFAARQLGVSLPPLDQIYCLAARKLRTPVSD